MIKVFVKTEGCFPQQFEVGDWYDLCAAEDIRLFAPVATALKYATKKNPVTEEEKLKWMLSGPMKLVRVDHLDNEPRGGFGEGTADPKKD